VYIVPKRKAEEAILGLTSVLTIGLVFTYVLRNFSTSIKDFKSSGLIAELYEDDYHEELENCQKTQKFRKNILKNGCEVLRNDSNFNKMINTVPNTTHFWMNKPRKLAICTPHKVGSQTWRYFFQQLDSKDRNGIGEEEYQLENWPENSNQFLKGFQVRHPLERLLSSFRFIFERDSMIGSSKNMRELIYNNYYEANQTEEFDPYKFKPSFKNFCQFVVDSGENFDVDKFPFASHWLPYYMQCNPCHKDYEPDHIIHMESILPDTLCYLDSSPGKIDSDALSSLRHVNMSPSGHSSTREIQMKYFSQLDESLLKRIQNKYWPDFLVYGYDLEPFLKLLRK